VGRAAPGRARAGGDRLSDGREGGGRRESPRNALSAHLRAPHLGFNTSTDTKAWLGWVAQGMVAGQPKAFPLVSLASLAGRYGGAVMAVARRSQQRSAKLSATGRLRPSVVRRGRRSGAAARGSRSGGAATCAGDADLARSVQMFLKG